MKNFFYIALICLLPNLLFAQQSMSSQQMDVMMKMASLRNALLKKDSVSLSSLLANDVTYGHSSGLIQTKAELIRSVMSGDQNYKTIAPSEMNVRVYDNSGVVTMKSDVSMIYQGNPLDLKMFITLVWIKKEGDWKLVARQSVKAPIP